MKIVLSTFFFFLITAISNAQPALRQKQFNLKEGVALQGYDPVAYITKQKAIKGKKEFAAVVDGVTYYMSSTANKDFFLKSPKTYEPQYGGWCAYAMGATGEKVEVDPETFKVENGKLYVFYNSLFNNTLPKWDKDETTLKPQAEKNWMSIYK